MGVRRFRWRVEGLAVGLAVGWGALRDRSCARREARGRISFCAARRVFCGSLPMLAPARSRCCLLGVWCGRGVRLSAFGFGCFLRGFWVSGGGVRCGSGDGVGCRGGSAGSVLRSQVSSGGGSAFALRAGFFVDRFQCSLRPDPAAARWGRRVNRMQKWLGRRRFPVQPLGLIP